ncbi:MAG: hypothetical protein Q7J34_12410 [Bacteroidales bacterium]|nr:hypothetical protein [Bacteroidales bacterium]
MNTLLTIGTTIVVFALIAYSIAIIGVLRKKTVRRITLIFITMGVILDLTATSFMILGSSKGMFTLHGFIGYSSLLGMTIDAALIWRTSIKTSLNQPISRALHFYSLCAWLWWIAAFLTGGLLVVLR